MFVFQITYATPRREEELSRTSELVKGLRPVRQDAAAAQIRAEQSAFTVANSAAKTFDRFILG